LFLLLLSAVNSQAASFTVEVTNRTSDVVLSDYPIKVEVMAKKNNWSFSSLLKTEGRTDADGNFSGEIEAGVDTFLVARVYYRGIEYSSGMKPFSAKEELYNLKVPVYEITSSGDGVSITSRKLQIKIINEQTLEVSDNLQVENSNGKTFIGAFNNELDLTQVLQIPMPSGYRLKGYQAGESPKIKTFKGAIVTQNEIKPGTSSISMSYHLQSDIGSFDLSLFSAKDAPATEELALYYPLAADWRMKQKGLAAAGGVEFGSKTYSVFKGKPDPILHMTFLGPAYKGGLGAWHVMMLLAFSVSAASLFSARNYIRQRHLQREREKLVRLQEKLVKESQSEELKDFYRPIERVINNRILEINSEVKKV
jgi:hypothetical protein